MDNGNEIKFEDIEFKYQISIGVTKEGQIAVKENITSLITAFGMLEATKDVIRMKMAKVQSKIIPPKGGIMSFVRGGMKK